MSSPAAWLTGAVAAANQATVSLGLQVDVSHEAWIGQDDYGKATFDDPVTLSALVQEGTNQIRRTDGSVITTRACISFLYPITHNGASGRREPIDPRDRITLPSGYTGPIVENVGAIVHTGPLEPITVVWLK
jgi:hypothetical protein